MSEPEARRRAVIERIDAACARVGRDSAEVGLVAVSKTWGPDRVQALAEAGQVAFGENRVQEALAKQDAMETRHPDVAPRVAWHLIGHLQRNKAKQVVGRFALVHGVDDAALARELDRRASKAGVRQPVLVQVKQGDEPSKSGCAPRELPELVDVVGSLEALELRGFMSIPPPTEDPREARRFFRELRELRDAARDRTGMTLPDLSMGMSGDFEIAIEEGATLVRVGTALFGERGDRPPWKR